MRPSQLYLHGSRAAEPTDGTCSGAPLGPFPPGAAPVRSDTEAQRKEISGRALGFSPAQEV